jgi:RNA polymerase sigma-54 factor
MELGQRPELRQKVTLSPQVYQGLSILAMPVAELQVLVEAELLENPVLELEEPDEAPAEAEEERSESAEDVDADQFVGGVQTFDDHLLGQIGMLDLDDETARAARAIVGSLDDDGFLCVGLSEIADIASVDCDVVERALEQLDPPGVGARSLAEAMQIQLDYLGLDEPVLLRMVREHLDDVAANHFRKVSRSLRIGEDEVRRLVGILRGLNPRPAGAFSPGPSPGYIVPDVTVRRFGDEWLVTPNSDAVPPLRVSSRYRGMLREGSGADKETVRYLKDKIRSAESFIRNVDRRKDTVSRIAQIVLEVQGDFFEDGKGQLRPLRLEDVAVEIGVHLSTVSRGVTGKYMSTPYGMYELKHFFSGGYRTSSGLDVAATSVKSRLKDMLSAEDPAGPVSDQRLVEMLSQEGIPVARRTVAKYREEMGIEPSWARKRRDR